MQSTNLTVQFQSPYNGLISYQYTFTYPGEVITHSGINNAGEIFTDRFYMNETTPTTANLTYTYIMSNGASQSSTYTFLIIQTWQNKTLMNMGEKDYGMLIGDRVFWMTLILVVLMGVGYLAVGTGGSIS